MSARHSTSSTGLASSMTARSCSRGLPKRWSPTRRSGASTSARASPCNEFAHMGLGPSLSIRQSQQLLLTPQLAQAIKLLQLSNLELDSYIAEEIAKNPLLEARSEEPQEEATGDFVGDDVDSHETPDDPGADELIMGHAEDDRPLDVDWQSEALETDSFSDVVTSGGSEEGFDFDRVQYAASSLAQYLQDQLHGQSGAVGDLARLIAETLDETGYLTIPLDQ